MNKTALFRKKPRQQRSAATWDCILEAAAQLFHESGYAATTTNRVAERAGVSIGSLYQYFPNKDVLLLALAERHLEQAMLLIRDAFVELDRRRPGLADTLELLIDTVIALHRREPEMHRLLFDQSPRSEAAAKRLRDIERDIAAVVAQHLLRLGAGGANPELRALLLVQGIEAQVHGAVLSPPPRQSIESCAREIKALWLAALS